MREKKRSFVSLWSESGSRIGHGGRTREIQDDITAAAATVTAIAAAVFFLDATKKYGRIITSFAVVPLALARVARVVKSANVNSLLSRRLSARPFFFHGDVDDRVKFLLRQRACLVARSRLALYGTGTTRKEKDGSYLGIASVRHPPRWTDCEG